jgi:hypothetical protein
MRYALLRKSQLLKLIWAPLAVVTAHAILASFIDHRQIHPALHLLGGAAVGYSAWHLIGILGTSPQPRRKQFIFGVLLSSVLFMLWEAGEFASDQMLGTKTQVSSSETALDLTLSLAGSALALLPLYILANKPQQ